MLRELGGLQRLLHRLQRRGRKGGALALLLAVGLLLAGGLVVRLSNPFTGAGWFPVITALALLVMAFGLVSGFVGVRALVVPQRVEPEVDRGEFLEMIGRMKKPLRVCTRCRILVHEFAGRECPECLSGTDLFEVRSEADVRVVSAVLR